MRRTFPAVLIAVLGLCALTGASLPEAQALTNGWTGGTLRNGPEGCSVACHGNSGAITVTLTGPAALDKGQSGTYVVAANILLRGVNVAALGGGTLSESAASLTIAGDEIVHTSSTSVTSYTFTYTMPLAGGAKLLYATGLAGVFSAWAFAPTLTVHAKPDAPTGLATSNVSSNSLDLSWAGTGPHYRVVYKTGATPPTSATDGTTVDVGTNTFASITGLSHTQQYSFAVYAKLDPDAIFSTNAATTSVTTLAGGTTYRWTGTTNNEWTEPTNWLPVGVPGTGDQAQFYDPAPVPGNINLATPVSINYMVFDSQAWTLSGASITMTTGLVQPSIQVFGASVDLTGSEIIVPTFFAVANDGEVLLGTVSGPGGFSMQGSDVTEVANLNVGGLVVQASGTLRASPTSGANELLLVGGILETNGSSWAHINGPGGTLAITGTVTIGANNMDTDFSGAIQGTGALAKVGAGTLTLLGTNTWTGGTTIDGTLRFGDGSVGTFPGGTFDNSGVLRYSAPPTNSIITTISGTGSLVVDAGALEIQGGGLDGNATIAGSALLTTGAVTFGGAMTVNPGTTWAGSNSSVGSLEGGGTVSVIAGFILVAGSVDSTFSGNISKANPPNDPLARVLKDGSSVLTLSGTIAPKLSIGGGVVELLGSAGHVELSSDQATLRGTGSVVELDAALNSKLEPGAGSAGLGTLTVQAGLPNGTLGIRIEGSGLGQYDVLKFTGSGEIAGALALSGPYSPQIGDVFRIVDKNGAAAPGGFTGLPQDSIIAFNGIPLRVSYVGGTGNDITLQPQTWTVTPVPGAPATNMSPNTPQVVLHDTATSFTVTPADGYHVASVTSDACGGSLTGNVYTTGAVTENCIVTATFAINQYNVTSGGGTNGTIVRTVPGLVDHGTGVSFTLTPNAGFGSPVIGGNCPAGTLAGNTYTTGPVTGDCQVSVVFALNAYDVTVTIGANGTVTPATTPRSANHNTQVIFTTVTPATGFHTVVGGNCPAGGFIGAEYRTGFITGPCEVTFTFVINQYTVTVTPPGANGTMDPSANQDVNHGSMLVFTLSPAPGYGPVMGGTCPGSLAGNTYTAGPITGTCSVTASFAQLVIYNVVLEGYQQVAPYVATAATGSGTASFNPVSKLLSLNLT